MPGVKLIVELDSDLADSLRHAAATAGSTPEVLAAEAVAQAYETGLRHRVLVERLEAVDAQIAAIALFVEQATAPAEGDGIDLDRLCRYRVDPFRGNRVGRVSSEWFSRPADQRFLSLSDLHGSVKARAERSRARTLESRAVRVEARRDDGDRLALILPGEPEPAAPTHWSFGQLASLAGAPAG